MTAAEALVRAAGAPTITALFESRAALHPDAVAVESDAGALTYGGLHDRVARAACALAAMGAARAAILSENRHEYLELALASARARIVLGCLNWRLTAPEQQHCIGLVAPSVLFVSPRMAGQLEGMDRRDVRVIVLGVEWERMLAAADGPAPDCGDAEAPWLILTTGGTTGLPKGAVLTQRAEIARIPAMAHDLGLAPGTNNLAWPPMYHMGGTDPALATLATGGRVIVQDGFDAERIAATLTRTRFGWVSVMPGAAARLADALERQPRPVAGVDRFGVMPDLVPQAEIRRLMRLVRAPWCNTFGSTETGTPPLSADVLADDGGDFDFGKLPSPHAAFRLMDEDGRTAPDGAVGEMAVRGPTLFSGYWNDDAATARDFRGGWFHMGDLFRRRDDGHFEFVERANYMIKSGGENVYPAEIERVLLRHPDVTEAVVVRRADPRWGEVPVALVATRGGNLDRDSLAALCRAHLAGYKQPKDIVAVAPDRLARTPTGKIPRAALEAWAAARSTDVVQ